MGAWGTALYSNDTASDIRDGEYKDFDIDEALNMQKDIPEYMVRVAKAMTI